MNNLTAKVFLALANTTKILYQHSGKEEMRKENTNSLVKMLEQIGIPFAYDHFAEGESPEPPFLCYLLPSSHNFSADGSVYHKIERVQIELYTDKKDPMVEQIVERILDVYGIFYQRSETWIGSEKLYEVLFTFEINRKDG